MRGSVRRFAGGRLLVDHDDLRRLVSQALGTAMATNTSESAIALYGIS
jgi:hypothetical protein